MPVLFIEAPPGIRQEKKRVMMQKFTEAIDEAYDIGDTLIFLREYPSENAGLDGELQSENPKILEALRRIGAPPTVERRSVASLTEMPSFAARSFNSCTELTHSIRERKQWQSR